MSAPTHQIEPRPYLALGHANALAHRGDRAGFPPGNRASAIQSAVDLGFDHIETDVRLSADGELVLFHDDHLDDQTTGSGRVQDQRWTELEQLRYRHQGEVLDEGLLRLSDALERWPQLHWNIDAKTGDVIEPLIETVLWARAATRVLITSFSLRNVRRIRRLAPSGVCTGLSRTEIALVRLAAWLRLPVPRLGDAAQVPVRHRNVTVVDRRFVDTCHRAGIAVHVWTVDDPAEMHRLLDLGVDALITDHPAALRDVLEARSAW